MAQGHKHQQRGPLREMGDRLRAVCDCGASRAVSASKSGPWSELGRDGRRGKVLVLRGALRVVRVNAGCYVVTRESPGGIAQRAVGVASTEALAREILAETT